MIHPDRAGYRSSVLETGIVTPDAGALVAFCSAGLGFDLVETFDFPQGTVHRMRRDAARLKVFQPATGTAPLVRPDPWHAHAGFAYAALTVTDITAAFAQAVAAGAEVLVEPVNHRPGASYALIADPQGNVWELLEESAG